MYIIEQNQRVFCANKNTNAKIVNAGSTAATKMNNPPITGITEPILAKIISAIRPANGNNRNQPG